MYVVGIGGDSNAPLDGWFEITRELRPPPGHTPPPVD
jgi:hypothetical protein